MAARPAPELRSAAAHVFVSDLDAVPLDDDDARHLGRVLRLRPDQVVTACDGSGRWRTCRVVAEGRGVSLAAEGPVIDDPPAEPEVTVAMALAKGDRTDWAVQKLTEVGVDRILLVAAARATVRWDGEKAAGGVARLARIARQAAMQSRRTRLPVIAPPVTVADAIASAGAGACAAEPGGGPLGLAHPWVLVGPEGGFAEGELPEGTPRVGLGPTVVRTETAAVLAGGALCLLRAGVLAGR